MDSSYCKARILYFCFIFEIVIIIMIYIHFLP